MPDADMANALVVGAVSGHIRTTKTWILGRLLRDRDDIVDEDMVGKEGRHVPPGQTPTQEPSEPQKPFQEWESLRISVFNVIEGKKHGVPNKDWVWYLGCSVILIQLTISIIPWIISGNWGIFMITIAGNFLAVAGASLSQWRKEKWGEDEKKGGATVTITQGNGSRHAMVILGKRGCGLDLEILARGTRTAKRSRFTRIAASVLAVLWIVLLGTVSGLKINTWCKYSCLR